MEADADSGADLAVAGEIVPRQISKPKLGDKAAAIGLGSISLRTGRNLLLIDRQRLREVCHQKAEDNFCLPFLCSTLVTHGTTCNP